MEYNKVAYVKVEGFGDYVVLVNTKEKKVFVTDGYFCGSGCITDKGEVSSGTNDITTNYLEVAIYCALKEIGITPLKEVTPTSYSNRGETPKYRTFKVEQVKDLTDAEKTKLKNRFGDLLSNII